MCKGRNNAQNNTKTQNTQNKKQINKTRKKQKNIKKHKYWVIEKDGRDFKPL